MEVSPCPSLATENFRREVESLTGADRDQMAVLLREMSRQSLANRKSARPVKPDVGGQGYSDRSSERPIFGSFGEQLKAVSEAARPGTQPDPRLFMVRSALGLSESVSADGGFLIEDFYAKEVFTKAQMLAKLAPLCRRVTIGPNSNSVRINAIAETSRVSSTWGGIISYWLE